MYDRLIFFYDFLNHLGYNFRHDNPTHLTHPTTPPQTTYLSEDHFAFQIHKLNISLYPNLRPLGVFH